MAHYEQVLTGEVDDLMTHLDRDIGQGSIPAKLQDRADHRLRYAAMHPGRDR